MLVVSRCVERIGDHAVDIGEQIAYLVTGDFRELTDASTALERPTESRATTRLATQPGGRGSPTSGRISPGGGPA